MAYGIQMGDEPTHELSVRNRKKPKRKREVAAQGGEVSDIEKVFQVVTGMSVAEMMKLKLEGKDLEVLARIDEHTKPKDPQIEFDEEQP